MTIQLLIIQLTLLSIKVVGDDDVVNDPGIDEPSWLQAVERPTVTIGGRKFAMDGSEVTSSEVSEININDTEILTSLGKVETKIGSLLTSIIGEGGVNEVLSGLNSGVESKLNEVFNSFDTNLKYNGLSLANLVHKLLGKFTDEEGGNALNTISIGINNVQAAIDALELNVTIPESNDNGRYTPAGQTWVQDPTTGNWYLQAVG